MGSVIGFLAAYADCHNVMLGLQEILVVVKLI